jgi:D-alanyl-D-alanine dipeptidase
LFVCHSKLTALILFHTPTFATGRQNPLVSQMRKQGFVNYSKQWRHFSMPGAGGAAYDFPIKPR